MRRPLTLVCLTLVAGALLAGCGGKKSAAPSTAPPVTVAPATTPSTDSTPTQTLPPTVTSASDLAACVELTTNLRVISALVRQSVEEITQALHPKELAKKMTNSQANLMYSAQVIELLEVPPSLERTQAQFVAAIRRFGADFGRAAKLTLKSKMLEASHELHDGVALTAIRKASEKIEQTCGNG